MDRSRWIHAINRFGFGATEVELDSWSGKTFRDYVQFQKSEPLQFDLSYYEDFDVDELKSVDKKEMRRKLASTMNKISSEWIHLMISSPYGLHEKLNLFWHDHFACEIKNPLLARNFTNTIREHAMGNFRDLLIGVSKSGGMIDYLNLKQNRKGKPNENFARELCELFTLGQGNIYTEQDIKEIARAFTGWSRRTKGGFHFRKRLHDRGQKNILGRKGKFTGEDVIDLILEHKDCARFICGKIYKTFIHPARDELRINEMTDVFYSSDYSIGALIEYIGERDWFYNDSNKMTIIKSPIEFIVSMGRQFNIKCDKTASWTQYQRLFNQILFRPPSVAGWKKDKEWINSNSLALRLRTPSIVLTGGDVEVYARPDYDSNPMDDSRRMTGRLFKGITGDWSFFRKMNPDIDEVTLFFNDKLSRQSSALLQENIDRSDDYKTLLLMSIPEYQLT